jgi:hypothetical protein
MSTLWSKDQLEAYAATLDLVNQRARERGYAALHATGSPCGSVDHPPGLPWTCGCPQRGVLAELETNTEPAARGHEPCTCLAGMAGTCDEPAGTAHTGDCPLAETLRPEPEPCRCPCGSSSPESRAHAVSCPRSGLVRAPAAELATGPAPVTAATIRAVIFEPLGLPGDQLPAWGTPLEEGSCLDCLLPVVTASGRCLYCQVLHDMRVTAPARNSVRAAKPGNPGTRNGSHRERLPGHSRCECRACRANRAGNWLLVMAMILTVVASALGVLMIEGVVTL